MVQCDAPRLMALCNRPAAQHDSARQRPGLAFSQLAADAFADARDAVRAAGGGQAEDQESAAAVATC